VALFFAGGRQGWWGHQERTIRKTRRARRTQLTARSTDSLREGDPDFDPDRFLARVGVAFEKAQSSWCAQDLEPLRPFVSDGVFERFSLQIEEQRADGWQQGMEELRVGALSIVGVEMGRQFDTLSVRVPFSASIDRRRLDTGERISGSKLARERFVECWSFLRRQGARTIDHDGLIEGKCPNCAAPLQLAQSARCGHCDCLARSGQFDWVLAEITQESVWCAERENAIPGLAAHAERDPGMSIQMLEDRASVAFWRLCAARRSGEIDPLMRVGSEAFCADFAPRLAPRESGRRSFLADCAVGSVRTLGFLTGEEREQAVIEVVWDGRLATVEDHGRLRLADERRRRRSLFVFGRKAGARSRVEESLTTAHCQNCGAHDMGGTASTCPFCEAPRTGDASAWLLDEITWDREAPGRKLLSRLEELGRSSASQAPTEPSSQSAIGLLSLCAEVALTDGELHPRERQALDSLAEHMGVSTDQLEELVAARGGGSTTPKPRDSREARAWLRHLIELALADGSLSRDERRLLHSAAAGMGLERGLVSQTLREVRSELYKRSRSARRGPGKSG